MPLTTEVKIRLCINGQELDIHDVATCLQRLMKACEPFLPLHRLDDTSEQKALRSAMSHVYDLKAFG